MGFLEVYEWFVSHSTELKHIQVVEVKTYNLSLMTGSISDEF